MRGLICVPSKTKSSTSLMASAFAALDGGMASGKPSVCFRIDLPDGRTVLAETSARLFVMAAAAIVGRWPDVDDGTMLAHIEKGRQSASIQILSDKKAD